MLSTDKVIIYPHNSGIAAVYPVMDCGLSLEQIALKDVPKGRPYRIIDASEIPTDRTFGFGTAWEADFSSPDGEGADYGAGSENSVVAWNEDGTPIVKAVG